MGSGEKELIAVVQQITSGASALGYADRGWTELVIGLDSCPSPSRIEPRPAGIADRDQGSLKFKSSYMCNGLNLCEFICII